MQIVVKYMCSLIDLHFSEFSFGTYYYLMKFDLKR